MFEFTFKRTHTQFTGGYTRTDQELPEQQVRIGKCKDEDEDLWQVWTADGKQHIVEGSDLSPHPTESELNTEFMVRMMEWSNPLVQGYVIEAVANYSAMVLAMSDEQKAEMDKGFISSAAWVDCAQTCKDLIDSRFARSPAG